jgi:hypothetical protein
MEMLLLRTLFSLAVIFCWVENGVYTNIIFLCCLQKKMKASLSWASASLAILIINLFNYMLHSAQMQQCSHCLRREDLCPGGGNGRACESLKTQRGKISDYMKYLRVRQGYTSLKMEYLQMQCNICLRWSP